MTREQIEILRSLIRGEIEAAIQNENGYKFSYEQEKANDQGWETFIDSFTRLRMTTTGGDSVGNV
jgi:hypothetical protein